MEQVHESPIVGAFKKAEKKGILLYHFSWGSIVTGAKVLLEAKHGIEDKDRLTILREIIRYYDDCGCIHDFSQMNTCWREVMKELSSSANGLSTKSKDNLQTVVCDWIQQEADLGDKLNRHLSGDNIINIKWSKKMTLEERIKNDISICH